MPFLSIKDREPYFAFGFKQLEVNKSNVKKQTYK